MHNVQSPLKRHTSIGEQEALNQTDAIGIADAIAAESVSRDVERTERMVSAEE